MKILLDARNPRFNGSWTYIANLVSKMVEMYPENEYIVLYDRTHGGIGLNRVDERVVKSLNPFVWVAWSHTVLPRILKKERVDVYHSLKQMNAPDARVKKIYTVHGATHFVYPQLRPWYDIKYWKTLTLAAARNGDQMVAVSDSDKRNLVYWAGIPEEKITVINLAAAPRFRVIDDPERKARVRERLGLHFPFILFSGRVDPYKNIIGMIRAYALSIKMNDTGHRLVVAGDKRGYQSSRVYDLIRDLGLTSRVFFTGHLHEDLEVVYNLADLFFFPSLYESFGLVLVEAMACGLPIVSTKVSGCIDVVGDAGILVDPLNIQEMAEAVNRVLASESLQQTLSKKSLARATSFSWERCAQETMGLYKRLKNG